MKRPRPPLLPVLAGTALLGAAVFLTSLTPSCDPRRYDAKSAQHRVFTSASAPATVTGDTIPPPPPSPRPAVSKSPLQNPDEFASTARIAAARREFLSTAALWQPEKAAEIAPLAATYRASRTRWIKKICETGNAGAFELLTHLTLPGNRLRLDQACADLSQLTPEGRKAFHAMEDQQWRDYQPAVMDDPAPYEPASGAGAASAVAVRASELSASAFVEKYGELFDQLEYLDDFHRDLSHREAALQDPSHTAAAPDAAARNAATAERFQFTLQRRLVLDLLTHQLQFASHSAFQEGK